MGFRVPGLGFRVSGSRVVPFGYNSPLSLGGGTALFCFKLDSILESYGVINLGVNLRCTTSKMGIEAVVALRLSLLLQYFGKALCRSTVHGMLEITRRVRGT